MTSATTTPMTESHGAKPMVHTAASATTDHTKETTSTLLTPATFNPVPLLRHTQARPNAFANRLNLCPSNPTSHRFENALTWKAGYHLAPTSLASTLSSRTTSPVQRLVKLERWTAEKMAYIKQTKLGDELGEPELRIEYMVRYRRLRWLGDHGPH